MQVPKQRRGHRRREVLIPVPSRGCEEWGAAISIRGCVEWDGLPLGIAYAPRLEEAAAKGAGSCGAWAGQRPEEGVADGGDQQAQDGGRERRFATDWVRGLTGTDPL